MCNPSPSDSEDWSYEKGIAFVGEVAQTKVSCRPRRSQTAATTNHRHKFRVGLASLPTALERDTLLVPEWIAESVGQEAECFLKADPPDNFAKRLAAKPHHLYLRHKHFKETLNRPGNLGRDNLYMYMRHWTAGWLKRKRSASYKKLPWSYAQGRALPATGKANQPIRVTTR